MSQQPVTSTTAPPVAIYIIRHGEKPGDPPDASKKHPAHGPPYGIDFQGVQNAHSLPSRGWQRSGALSALFDPVLGPLHTGLLTPGTLLSPSHGSLDKTIEHRTYQTIQGLAGRLGLQIDIPFAEGQEAQLAASLVSSYSGVVLICWDHAHIPALASALPLVPDTAIPQKWPDDRFDVIWAFTLVPGSLPAQYAFTQIPQQLLSGDADTVIPAWD